MERVDMLRMLHELDKRLSQNVEIHICGASSAILRNRLSRTTSDVDVLRSFPSIDTAEFRKIVDDIDRSPYNRDGWLNDCAKAIVDALPKSYKFDLEPIDGEIFEKLRPLVISAADFVICKLALGKGQLRAHDTFDLGAVILSDDDIKLIYRKFDEISVDAHGQSLMMEGAFKSARPGAIYTIHGGCYLSLDEILVYSKERYGIEYGVDTAEKWKRDILSCGNRDNEKMRVFGDIIGRIDYKAGLNVTNGNIEYALHDRDYRKRLRTITKNFEG